MASRSPLLLIVQSRKDALLSRNSMPMNNLDWELGFWLTLLRSGTLCPNFRALTAAVSAQSTIRILMGRSSLAIWFATLALWASIGAIPQRKIILLLVFFFDHINSLRFDQYLISTGTADFDLDIAEACLFTGVSPEQWKKIAAFTGLFAIVIASFSIWIYLNRSSRCQRCPPIAEENPGQDPRTLPKRSAQAP